MVSLNRKEGENMKCVLVTGGTGWLGKRVIQDLITTDYRVVVVSRNAERLQSLQSLGDVDRLRLIPCDLADVDQTSRLTELVNDINVLVHLAGRRPIDPNDHSACTRQVIMSLNLIQDIGPRIDQAVLGSCVSVYGVDAGMRVAANHLTYPRTYHGTSQLACEKFWKLFSISSGKPVACLRFDDFRGTGANLESHTYSGTETGGSSSGRESEEEVFLAEASRRVLQIVNRGGNDIENIYFGVPKSTP
jgi:nucleoside-diphosphate-sugar epimerase